MIYKHYGQVTSNCVTFIKHRIIILAARDSDVESLPSGTYSGTMRPYFRNKSALC